ncbi:UDP-N-acetylmuramoyl-L-alanine--D-glutamate ligase [Bacillus taeanensis]|uniref:UDP-N-acetylmuramoylalanine--D-glutamate ligase n=1 Tax=Bacillus taeanensis TaxID=273032 RepID=A0A366Y1C3_9BACI|nr:UDP-N-acetylmuramoyl-L-alanine--D-glutamate ligase [Bacillus taeanensis]RBW70213.1 UDP-N-acetylmuramoyl-L-alanine--D-glutamate ligase [Bacillus taeanensis]
MKKYADFSNKNVLVLGIAKSGYAAAKLLKKLGAEVVVNDLKPLEENESAQELQKEGIEVVTGSHPMSLLDRKLDYVVKNPGIPYSNQLVNGAIERDIPVITEVEIAGLISKAEFVGITGSNGKTTTTTLIGEMLKGSNKKPVVAGNIGTVVCEVAASSSEDEIIVTELSSFQLLGIRRFQPKISVLLNIFDAHLDYHGTKEEYMKAKAKLFANQTNMDYTVYNADDSLVCEMVKTSKAQMIPFSRMKTLDNGVYVKEGKVYFKGEAVLEVNDIVLPGKHNLENILAAVAVAKLLYVSNDWIHQVLTTFTGVKHRLQYVTEINGRKFYNDSKATNILATKTAIEAFSEPVVLIAGGLDRGNGFDDLVSSLNKKVKALITYGQTAEKLKEAGEKAGINVIEKVNNVEQAVSSAYQHSTSGDVILLSPACASWDQYKSFEQRGDIFVNQVHKLVL